MYEPLIARDPAIVTSPDVEGPELTDEMIRAAEQRLGVRLPASLLDRLRIVNGGDLADPAAFPANVDSPFAEEDHVPVFSLNGIPAVGEEGRYGTGAGLLSSAYLIREWQLPENLVLLTGDGHSWIALDYRESGASGEPAVVWVDETPTDARLADSFADFLAGLVPLTDYEPDDE